MPQCLFMIDNTLSWSADVVNALFAAFSVMIVHCLFRSPRKLWQCILAWSFSFIFCVIFTPVFCKFEIFSSMPYERVSMVMGFFCLTSYIYLFPQLPIAQRVFVYFMIVNLMYDVVIVARYLSGLFVSFTNWDTDILFLSFYIIVFAAVTYLLLKFYAKPIVEQLKSTRGLSLRYALFAAFNYCLTMLIVDAWGPLEKADGFEMLKVFFLCAVSFTSYYAIFSSLMSMKITARKELYKKTASTDVLTGLGNRLAYETYLNEKSLTREPICCIFLDINNLKQINDTYGHQYGDEVLKNSAQTLKKIAGDAFRVFRIGGDEFTFVSINMGLASARMNEIESKLEALTKSETAASFAWGIGQISDYTNDSVKSMIGRCDNAMYENKRHHKKPVSFVPENKE